MERRMQAEREKEERSLKAFVITGPLVMLVIAMCLWSADTQ